MEYTLVIALLFVLLIPGVYLYYTYSQTSIQEISSAKITDIGNSIINNAENSYYLGKGSKITLDVNMPNGLTNMSINCDNITSSPPRYCEVVFQLLGVNEIVYSTKAPMMVKNMPVYPGYFTEDQISAGAKRIIIETQRYVEVDIQ